MKTKKRSKKNKKEQEEIKPAVPAEPGMIHIPLSEQELLTLLNLMNVASKTFDMLASQSLSQGDEESYNVFSARKKLSEIYITKLGSTFAIGEPESREFH